jgi:hypothetical protein
MARHRGSFLALALSAVIGLMAGEARAGTLTIVIFVPGHVTPITVFPGAPLAQSGSDNTSLGVITTGPSGLNAALAADGSAISFSNLGASSDYPGASGSGTLSLTGLATIQAGATGSNSLLIETVLFGYNLPSAPSGTLHSSTSSLYTNTTTSSTQSFSSDYSGTVIAPTLTSTSTGPVLNGGTIFNNTPIPTFVSPYDLHNATTFTLTASDVAAVASDQISGSTQVTVPEPASLAMFLTGMSVPLVVVSLLRRRRRAVA